MYKLAAQVGKVVSNLVDAIDLFFAIVGFNFSVKSFNKESENVTTVEVKAVSLEENAISIRGGGTRLIETREGVVIINEGRRNSSLFNRLCGCGSKPKRKSRTTNQFICRV